MGPEVTCIACTNPVVPGWGCCRECALDDYLHTWNLDDKVKAIEPPPPPERGPAPTQLALIP